MEFRLLLTRHCGPHDHDVGIVGYEMSIGNVLLLIRCYSVCIVHHVHSRFELFPTTSLKVANNSIQLGNYWHLTIQVLDEWTAESATNSLIYSICIFAEFLDHFKFPWIEFISLKYVNTWKCFKMLIALKYLYNSLYANHFVNPEKINWHSVFIKYD